MLLLISLFMPRSQEYIRIPEIHLKTQMWTRPLPLWPTLKNSTNLFISHDITISSNAVGFQLFPYKENFIHSSKLVCNDQTYVI